MREALGAAIYSYSMNYMGLPAGNVPAHFAGGLPIGVQIVGRPWEDATVLDFADRYKAERRGRGGHDAECSALPLLTAPSSDRREPAAMASLREVSMTIRVRRP